MNEQQPRKMVEFGIIGAVAYSAKEIDNALSLGALLDSIQAAIDKFGPDALVVVRDVSNEFGAAYGSVAYGDLIRPVDDDDL